MPPILFVPNIVKVPTQWSYSAPEHTEKRVLATWLAAAEEAEYPLWSLSDSLI